MSRLAAQAVAFASCAAVVCVAIAHGWTGFAFSAFALMVLLVL